MLGGIAFGEVAESRRARLDCRPSGQFTNERLRIAIDARAHRCPAHVGNHNVAWQRMVTNEANPITLASRFTESLIKRTSRPSQYATPQPYFSEPAALPWLANAEMERLNVAG